MTSTNGLLRTIYTHRCFVLISSYNINWGSLWLPLSLEGSWKRGAQKARYRAQNKRQDYKYFSMLLQDVQSKIKLYHNPNFWRHFKPQKGHGFAVLFTTYCNLSFSPVQQPVKVGSALVNAFLSHHIANCSQEFKLISQSPFNKYCLNRPLWNMFLCQPQKTISCSLSSDLLRECHGHASWTVMSWSVPS